MRKLLISSIGLLFMMVVFLSCVDGQDTRFPGDSIGSKMINGIGKSYEALGKKLSSASEKYLERLQKKEARLIRKIAARDSALGAALGQQSEIKYAQARLNNGSNKKSITSLQNYHPVTDSLQTGFKLLEKTGMSPEKLSQVKKAAAQISGLQSQVNKATDIRKFISQRKQVLKDQLDKFGLAKELKSYSKEAYYYSQQVSEYKAMLADTKKLEAKALHVLRNSSAFKDFMAKNSMLSQLFPVPGGYGTTQALQGLQTRGAVQQQLVAQIGQGGPGVQQYVQQQVQSAQSQMNVLKDKINKAGGGNSDIEIPDFKPNRQRTKSFLQRIEYGLNIQSQKTNSLLPVTSDIAFTAGYKINDKSVIGIGAGYKIGWGKNISNIKISSQGVSVRSYVDVKLKGSTWISGGYEYNYQHEFEKIDQLKDLNAWQKSGLIGLTKKYKVGKKNGNLQLLWDFLSYSQVPVTQPLKFRIGYTL